MYLSAIRSATSDTLCDLGLAGVLAWVDAPERPTLGAITDDQLARWVAAAVFEETSLFAAVQLLDRLAARADLAARIVPRIGFHVGDQILPATPHARLAGVWVAETLRALRERLQARRSGALWPWSCPLLSPRSRRRALDLCTDELWRAHAIVGGAAEDPLDVALVHHLLPHVLPRMVVELADA